jgi:hypothetical protein
MSAPINGDSRQVVVKHGSTEQLLTQYAPSPESDDSLTIINLGTERVWLSNDSTAGPNHSTPIEGGTASVWTAGGTVYAFPDASNVTDVTLVLTSGVVAYEPSPYALASYAAGQIEASGLAQAIAEDIAASGLPLAVAQQILANGVPNVLVETDVAQSRNLAAGATDNWNVSDAASAVLSVTGTVNDLVKLFVTQKMSNGQLIVEDLLSADETTDASMPTALARLALPGASIAIKNTGAEAVTYSLTTSNRSAPRWDSRRRTAKVAKYSVANDIYSNGSVLAMTPDDYRVKMQGLVYLTFSTSCTAWRVTMQDVTSGTETSVADSGEAFTTSSGAKRVSKLVGVPPGAVIFTFYVLADFTGAGTLNLTQAEL